MLAPVVYGRQGLSRNRSRAGPFPRSGATAPTLSPTNWSAANPVRTKCADIGNSRAHCLHTCEAAPPDVRLSAHVVRASLWNHGSARLAHQPPSVVWDTAHVMVIARSGWAVPPHRSRGGTAGRYPVTRVRMNTGRTGGSCTRRGLVVILNPTSWWYDSIREPVTPKGKKLTSSS